MFLLEGDQLDVGPLPWHPCRQAQTIVLIDEAIQVDTLCYWNHCCSPGSSLYSTPLAWSHSISGWLWCWWAPYWIHGPVLSLYRWREVRFLLIQMLRQSITTSGSSPWHYRDPHFRNKLNERNGGCCVLTRALEIYCDAVHLLPHSKADEVRDPWHDQDLFIADNLILILH